MPSVPSRSSARKRAGKTTVARRTNSPRRATVKRTPESTRSHVPWPRLALLPLVVLLFFAAIHARGLADDSHPSLPAVAPFTYTVVDGDTAASIASLFATDTAEISAQGGDTPTAGAPISIDAALLWKRMTGDPFASTETLVENAARKMGVQPSLALAVAWQESRLRQEVRSETGAVGIMQVEPDTSRLASRDLGVPLDASVAGDNVTAGLFWLHSLLASYGNDRASTLAAYYEGSGNLARRGYLDGTAEYVSHVQQIENALLTANPHLDS